MTKLRILMRRMREIIADTGSLAVQLDKLVHLIADLVAADVCTVYLKRRDDSLEVFATKGLDKQAAHATLLHGEGLVGHCAETAASVNAPDAQSHAHFSYRSGNAEDVYESLLAVPIMRAGKVLGVLVAHNRTRRVYSEEDVEVLKATAMVVADLLVPSSVTKAENIFISYRRSDTRHIAGRIYDRLGNDFPKESVFFDVEKIPIGINFRTFIRTNVNSSFVMLSIIGTSWMKKMNWMRPGLPFVAKTEDFVRIEIELALEFGVPVLPLLVDDARMPARTVLPNSIAPIATTNAASVRSGRDFHSDMDIVVNKIRSMERRNFQ